MEYIITPDGKFYSRDELYHYGVKGMKWGVRRNQNKDKNNDVAKRKIELSDKQKKYLKIGAIAAGTALALYGTAKIASYVGGQKEAKYYAKKAPVYMGNWGATLARQSVVRGEAVKEGLKASKRVLAIGHSAVAVGLAAYGSTKVSEWMKQQKEINKPSIDIPNTTGKLLKMDIVDERTGKRTGSVVTRESIYTEPELRKKEKESLRSGNYTTIDVSNFRRS